MAVTDVRTGSAVAPEVYSGADRRHLPRGPGGRGGLDRARRGARPAEGRPAPSPPGGYVHGGVWVAFADTVAAWGTIRNLGARGRLHDVELKTNVLRRRRPGRRARGRGPATAPRSQHPGLGGADHEGDRNAAFFTCTQMVLAPSGRHGGWPRGATAQAAAVRPVLRCAAPGTRPRTAVLHVLVGHPQAERVSTSRVGRLARQRPEPARVAQVVVDPRGRTLARVGLDRIQLPV